MHGPVNRRRILRAIRARAQHRVFHPPAGGSLPAYLRKAVPGSFHIEEVSRHEYKDRLPRVRNKLVPVTIEKSHLVLRDANNHARLTLQYEVTPDYVIIGNVQRERTQYRVFLGEVVWQSQKETREARAFDKMLGMNSGIFLVNEFLHRHLKDVREGDKHVVLRLPNGVDGANYRNLIGSFFSNGRSVPFDEALRYAVSFVREQDPDARQAEIESLAFAIRAGRLIYTDYPLDRSKKAVQKLLHGN